MEDESYDLLFKIVVIGDSTVGKTSLLQRFKNGSFSEHHSCTIGVDFIVKTLEIDGRVVKLHIWDTAGQERFKSVSHSFYHSADAAIVVYDITNEGSFYTMTRWLADIRRFAPPKTLCMLVGNKLDAAHQRTVSKESAVQFAKENRISAVFEASAKENKIVGVLQPAARCSISPVIEATAKDIAGVDDMFSVLTAELLRAHQQVTIKRIDNISSDSDSEGENSDVIHYRKRHVVPVVSLHHRSSHVPESPRNCQC